MKTPLYKCTSMLPAISPDTGIPVSNMPLSKDLSPSSNPELPIPSVGVLAGREIGVFFFAADRT